IVEPSFFRLPTSSSLILMIRVAMAYVTYHSLIFSWDSTRLASSASLQTTVNPPTRSPTRGRPMFFYRTAHASRSISPLAKPW
uniref:Uncharacterized protein n=1 Tax=Denticeps clupeoides TaxID=299321 RepID=A0AAY4EXN1_9TELE